MNINPSAAAAVAGLSRAAAKGGESDSQAAESLRQQSVSDKPGGKATDSSEVDAGEQTSDRGGDGRQTLDVFEGSDENHDQPEPQEPPSHAPPASSDGTGERLDLQA